VAGSASLVISILADVSKAANGIDSVDQKLDGFGNAAKRMGETLAGAFSLSKVQQWVTEWVGAARDAQGSARQVQIVFGEQAAGVQAYAKQSANALGLSTAAYQSHAALAGNMLKNLGMSQEDAAKSSQALIERGAAMANVWGGDVGSALEKVEGIMRGRGTAAAKEWGVVVKEGDVNARLLAKGLGDLTGEALESAKAQERLAIFMEQTNAEGERLAAGGVGTGLALQQLSAKTEDLKATLGEALLPVLKAVIPVLQALADLAGRYPKIFTAVVLIFTSLITVIGIATVAAGVFGVTLSAAIWPVTAVVAAIVGLIAVVVLLTRHWDTVSNAAKAAWEWMSKYGALLGPIGAVVQVAAQLAKNWDSVTAAVRAAYGILEKIGSLASKIGGLISKIPGVGSASVPGSYSMAGGASTFAGFGVGFPGGGSPSIVVEVNGDVGDPVVLGRRMVGALEAWVAANGRARLHELVGA
jgi:hypothetical protein